MQYTNLTIYTLLTDVLIINYYVSIMCHFNTVCVYFASNKSKE